MYIHRCLGIDKMKITIPNITLDIRGLPSHKKEQYARKIIKEVVEMNPHGVTLKGLEKALPLDYRTIEKHLFALIFTNEVYTEKIGATILYLSNIAGMREGTKEAISFGGREYDISVIENREGEFVMIRQREKGDTKGGVIIPKEKFKEFVQFQKIWVEGND